MTIARFGTRDRRIRDMNGKTADEDEARSWTSR